MENLKLCISGWNAGCGLRFRAQQKRSVSLSGGFLKF
jgi:hypothetical protein